MERLAASETPGALAALLHDFRIGEIEPITESRVVEFVDDVVEVCTWMGGQERNAFLTGLHTALARSYWSKDRVLALFQAQDFQQSGALHLIRIQEDESSQTTLVQLLCESSSGFEEKHEFDTSSLLYVDDATFTGRALAKNLDILAERLSNSTRTVKTLNVFHILQFTADALPVIQPAIDRLARIGVATVMRAATDVGSDDFESDGMTIVPSTDAANRDNVRRFLKSHSQLRIVADNLDRICKDDQPKQDRLFHNSFEREVVTRALLDVGIKIRSITPNWNPNMRPLGFVYERSKVSFGFGSLFCTFHNSANTSPLALWWGDTRAGGYSALSKWNPLLPRRPQ